jgi:hypothetical protein
MLHGKTGLNEAMAPQKPIETGHPNLSADLSQFAMVKSWRSPISHRDTNPSKYNSTIGANVTITLMTTPMHRMLTLRPHTRTLKTTNLRLI